MVYTTRSLEALELQNQLHISYTKVGPWHHGRRISNRMQRQRYPPPPPPSDPGGRVGKIYMANNHGVTTTHPAESVFPDAGPHACITACKQRQNTQLWVDTIHELIEGLYAGAAY